MSAADALRLSLVVIHFGGLAAIVGPFLAQVTRAEGFRVTAMLAGSVVQVLSGVALVAVRRAEDLPLDGTKIALKLLIAVAVVALALITVLRQRALTRRGGSDRGLRPLFFAVGIAAIANIVIAVFWT
ncbi:hypothetical protein F6B41_03385 [Microbacterium lushaniae]|nr:hypothetical protein F6B41_03385 [Microbacterium lushaniae]